MPQKYSTKGQKCANSYKSLKFIRIPSQNGFRPIRITLNCWDKKSTNLQSFKTIYGRVDVTNFDDAAIMYLMNEVAATCSNYVMISISPCQFNGQQTGTPYLEPGMQWKSNSSFGNLWMLVPFHTTNLGQNTKGRTYEGTSSTVYGEYSIIIIWFMTYTISL